MEVNAKALETILMFHYSMPEVDTLMALLEVEMPDGEPVREALIEDYVRFVRSHQLEDTDEVYRARLKAIVKRLPKSPLGTKWLEYESDYWQYFNTLVGNAVCIDEFIELLCSIG